MHGQGGGQEHEGGERGNEAESRARRLDQTAVFIGAVVAIATLAIGAGLLYFLLNENDGDRARADAAAAEKTTTTTAGSTTTAPNGAAGTLPATGGPGASKATSPTTAPPTPMATADPTDPPYQPVPVPAGVGATLTSCRWEPTNGGQLEASGTITSAADDDIWFVAVYWLQNDRELDDVDPIDVYDFDFAGQTKAWSATTPAPQPPADLRCAVEIT